MGNHLMAIGLESWLSIAKGHDYPITAPTNTEGMKHFANNAKAVNAILAGLTKSVFAKVMHVGFMLYSLHEV